MGRFRKFGFGAAIKGIEAAGWLDAPAQAVGRIIARSGQVIGRPGKRLADGLHGSWYGHPLHPSLVTLPIGNWTLALGIDALSLLPLGRRHAGAAEAAIRTGILGAIDAAAAGTADWQHTDGRDRRVGFVHALVNSTALGFNCASLALRRRGHPIQGRLASAAGWSCMVFGGYLGGHLVYRRRIGVDHADRSPVPRDFQSVLPLAELPENRPRLVALRDEVTRQDIGIVLVRQGEAVHAMGARCAHQGGPLDQGWVLDGTLVCPWHGSRYNLATGQPASGPSTCPQPRYAVRIKDGMIEIRREQEPGDEIVTAQGLPSMTAPSASPPGRKADEVLTEHHQLLRRLFKRIEATPAEDPQRRDLMRVLASELEIHEHVEDHLFYPAVRPVTEDVPIAYAEHGQMADLLAMTLKLNTASPEFIAHLRALHEAVEHHAGSEERSMFVQAQRLGETRLREIGHRLEAMLEEQRTSRFQQAFRALKIALIEAV